MLERERGPRIEPPGKYGTNSPRRCRLRRTIKVGRRFCRLAATPCVASRPVAPHQASRFPRIAATPWSLRCATPAPTLDFVASRFLRSSLGAPGNATSYARQGGLGGLAAFRRRQPLAARRGRDGPAGDARRVGTRGPGSGQRRRGVGGGMRRPPGAQRGSMLRSAFADGTRPKPGDSPRAQLSMKSARALRPASRTARSLGVRCGWTGAWREGRGAWRAGPAETRPPGSVLGIRLGGGQHAHLLLRPACSGASFERGRLSEDCARARARALPLGRANGPRRGRVRRVLRGTRRGERCPLKSERYSFMGGNGTRGLAGCAWGPGRLGAARRECRRAVRGNKGEAGRGGGGDARREGLGAEEGRSKPAGSVSDSSRWRRDVLCELWRGFFLCSLPESRCWAIPALACGRAWGALASRLPVSLLRLPLCASTPSLGPFRASALFAGVLRVCFVSRVARRRSSGSLDV